MVEPSPRFAWDDANRSHLARHGVDPEEAEQVHANQPYEIEQTTVGGEPRLLALGETDEGRVLFLVTTEREGRVRPVTAWPAKKKHRETYRTWRSRDEGSAEDPAV